MSYIRAKLKQDDNLFMKRIYILAIALIIVLIAGAIFFLYFHGRSSTLSDFEAGNGASQKLYYIDGASRERYLLQPPYEYDKEEAYPLVIALHGLTKSRDVYFSPVIVDNGKQQKEFPCFYLAPNNTSKGWDKNAQWVRELISEIMATYSIDPNRIYIIGFSCGGSGSYLFADALYREKNINTAGIVRCAGKSQTTLSSELFSQTAVWYHVGTEDMKSIRETAKETFLTYKAAYPDHEELSTRDSGGSLPRETITLLKDNKEIMKYSVYVGMGHEYKPIFAYNDILDWLFNISL